MGFGLDSNAKLVISVDVEDWPQSTWDHSLEITERAEYNTECLLDILSQHGQMVTMFVLGKFAERFPKTIKRIVSEGHEVASHGYGHIEIFNQNPLEFREDVLRAKKLLEDLTGKPVLGYRAPDFSIISTTTWSLDILAESGHQYDSSIFPIGAKRYGIMEWPTHPVHVILPSKRSIVELPIATFTILNRRWPVAGGGYHRLLPWPLIRWTINHQLHKGIPFVSYCHPYELDSKELSSLNFEISLKTRLHQGLGRRGFRRKFENLLLSFESEKASVIAALNWPHYALE